MSGELRSAAELLAAESAAARRPRTIANPGLSNRILDLMNTVALDPTKPTAMSTVAIAAALKVTNTSSVASCCSYLASQGALVRVRHGFYQVTAMPEPAPVVALVPDCKPGDLDDGKITALLELLFDDRPIPASKWPIISEWTELTRRLLA